MASYFVVGATLDAAANPEVWAALGAGAGTAIDWLIALRIVALPVSAVLLALGRFAGVIPRAWIAFRALRVFGGPLPWEGGVQGAATQGMAVMADVAVAASLMLASARAARADLAQRRLCCDIPDRADDGWRRRVFPHHGDRG